MSQPDDESNARTTDEGTTLEFEDAVLLDTNKDRLWSIISDPETLTRCVPGAEKVERVSKRKYTCVITRGISHLTISLSGEAEFVEMNEPDWIVAKANAYDPKTHSDFDVLGAMEMAERDNGAVELSYTAEVSYTGGIASLNATLVRPIVQSDIDTYFDNLAAEIEDSDRA